MSATSISIVIPAFNVEKYLTAALDSIEAQTEPPDEVILIDDGSTDGTLALAMGHHLSMPYRVVSTQNLGQGPARNLGASMASSEYVHFFDADDLMESHFIETMRDAILCNNKPDLILFSGESFNDQDLPDKRWANYRRGINGFFECRSEFLDKALSQGALFGNAWAYLSKTKFWGAERFLFSSDYLEDAEIFFPLIFACRSYLVLNEPLIRRRFRAGSTMTMTPNEKHLGGASRCLKTNLNLHGSPTLSARERWHVAKRLQFLCQLYLLMARSAGANAPLAEIAGVVSQTRDWGLAVKAFGYYIRADKWAIARSTARALRRARSKLLR